MSVTSHPLATEYLQHQHSIYLQVTIMGFTKYTGQKEDKHITANSQGKIWYDITLLHPSQLFNSALYV